MSQKTNRSAVIILLIMPLLFLLGNHPSFANAKVNFKNQPELSNCSSCSRSSGCIENPSGQKASTASFAGNGFIIIVLTVMTFYLYRNTRRKIYLVGGILMVMLILGSSYFAHVRSADCFLPKEDFVVDTIVGSVTDVARASEFQPTGAEFAAIGKEFDPSDKIVDKQMATNIKDEFAPAGGEFTPSGEVTDTLKPTVVKDQFAAVTDEFAPLDSSIVSQSALVVSTDNPKAIQTNIETGTSNTRFLIELGILFLLVAIIGIAIKYPAIRNYRGLFLMGTLVYFGFYKGGCPCMISSFQNTILAGLGNDIPFISMIWFLGLLPLTYFFGKIWCGWLCHLGALQEFIFLPAKLKFLQSVNNQRILRYIRAVLLIVLLVQLMITRTNLFIHYDPLKVAFNLFSANTTGYVLLILLLISSVLIYRPFCRAACPVGLILGWIAMLPGARRLSKNETCIDCISCSKPCKSHAMIYENKKSSLQVQDCILCGDCMGSCKKKSILLIRTTK